MKLLKRITAAFCAVAVSLSLCLSAGAISKDDLPEGVDLGFFDDLLGTDDYDDLIDDILDEYEKSGDIKESFREVLKDEGISEVVLAQFDVMYSVILTQLSMYAEEIIAQIDLSDLTDKEKEVLSEILGIDLSDTAKGGKISEMDIAKVDAQSYTGKSIKPEVVIKDGSYTLKNGTDYTLTYTNNQKVGKATVKITGKGNYSGTVSKTFKINPAVPSDLSVTFLSSGSAKISWDKAPGAGGYQIYYSTKADSGFKKLVSTAKLTYTTKKITATADRYLKIRSYKTVSGVKYYSEYSDVIFTGKESKVSEWVGSYHDETSGNEMIIAQNGSDYKVYLAQSEMDDDSIKELDVFMEFDVSAADFSGKSYNGKVDSALGIVTVEMQLTDDGITYDVSAFGIPVYSGAMTKGTTSAEDMLKLIDFDD